MRAAALVALLLAGCVAGQGVAPSPSPSAATAASAAPMASIPTTKPTVPPTATPVPNTVYTADDEEIAKLIRAGAAEAIPELKLLNDMDPSQLEDQFLPLGVWITSQREGVESYTPSSCTATAVELFIKGIDLYDDIRERFLAWRDWGAHGHAFAFAAPGRAAATLEESLVELEAQCPASSSMAS